MKLFNAAMENTKIVTNQVTSTGKNLVFAGLGTYSLMEENTKKVFETLVEKGQKIEGPKPLKTPDQLKNLSTQIKDQGKKVEAKVQEVMNGFLHRFGVPSRDEVQILIKRVETLTKKIDGIKA